MTLDSRTDWSVAVDLLTEKQLAEACADEGYFELAVELTRRHAEALMAGSPVAVVEVPRVVELADWRGRRT